MKCVYADANLVLIDAIEPTYIFNSNPTSYISTCFILFSTNKNISHHNKIYNNSVANVRFLYI